MNIVSCYYLDPVALNILQKDLNTFNIYKLTINFHEYLWPQSQKKYEIKTKVDF